MKRVGRYKAVCSKLPHHPYRVALLSRQMGIRRQSFQSNVFQLPANGKMVKALEPFITQPQNFMHRVIEETADSGTAQRKKGDASLLMYFPRAQIKPNDFCDPQ